MSLLMDALRKAEEAKRQVGEGQPATPRPATQPTELTLEPVSGSNSSNQPGSPLPVLAQHIDSVDADLAAVSTTPQNKKTMAPPPAPKPARTASNEADERVAARNVFTVKHTEKSRTPLWIGLSIVTCVTLGGLGYFWWQLQSVASGSLSHPAPPPPLATTLAAPPPFTLTEPPKTLPPSPPPTETQHTQAVTETPLRPERMERSPRPERARQAAPATDSEAPIRLSSSRQKTDPALNRAYDALQADKLNDARREYEQVLRNDPKNTDALLGLATIAARQGQSDNAAALYLRVLESDPKDVNAQAGLINLKGQSDPALSESRLKTLLSSQPESSPLHFALGNLYAGQARWSDAQQAYFRAYSAEPDNADYLFNLAVSLDHLHQEKLAARYYQTALDTAGNHSVAFDRNQVKRRLLELQP